jgi:hypothetical protein
MQRHYTSPKLGAGAPEDDGRSLLAVDQYRLEVNEIGRFSVVQEIALVERARSGDMEAKSLLVESCLPYVYSLAWRLSMQHPSNSDPLDLAQVGNEGILMHLDEALRSRYTCAFLRLVARRVMWRYCIEDKTIRVPATTYRSGRRAPLVVSLMASARDGRTLLDLLEDADFSEVAHV